MNEKKSPPRWECEDKCLTENSDGLLCGDTDHFTSFALLFNGAGSNDCDDDDLNLIFDSYWKDGLLIGCTVCFLMIILFLIVILLGCTQKGSEILRGSEGHRIHSLRNSLHNAEEFQSW